MKTNIASLMVSVIITLWSIQGMNCSHKYSTAMIQIKKEDQPAITVVKHQNNENISRLVDSTSPLPFWAKYYFCNLCTLLSQHGMRRPVVYCISVCRSHCQQNQQSLAADIS